MTDYRKNGSAVGGGGMANPMSAVGDMIVGGAAGAPARLAAGSAGYIQRIVGGTPAWRELSAAGLGGDRPTAAAAREGQTYWSTDAAAGLELSLCVHKGGATYAWEILAYGAPGLPVAAGAGEVPLSTGAGTTYVAADFGDEVGAAVAALIGAVSGQTFIGDGAGDVGTTSAPVSALLAASTTAGMRSALGLASVPTAPVALGAAYNAGTADAIYVDAVPAPADAFGPGRSLVYLFRSLGTLGAANILIMHADTTTTVARGWHLRAGDNASARGEISLILAGLPGSTVLPLPGADFTGADGVHCLAVAITALGVVRYSWDGGAVATAAAGAGTYAPAQAADPWRIGSSAVAGGGFAATTVQPIALRTYSTVLSDADLVAVCAQRASYLLAAPSAGTLTTDLLAAQFRGAATAIDRASSQRWRLVGALLVHEQVP